MPIDISYDQNNFKREGTCLEWLRYEKRPQGDSNPRYRRERAMSLTGLDDGDV